jgi:hypothetical protein
VNLLNMKEERYPLEFPSPHIVQSTACIKCIRLQLSGRNDKALNL